MNGHDFKDGVFERFAHMASALASPKRLEIVDVLAQGERDAETLAMRTGLSMANASRDLQILRQANLVASRKDGLQVFYRVSDPTVLRGYWALQSLAQDRLAGVSLRVREFTSSADGLKPWVTNTLADEVSCTTGVSLRVAWHARRFGIAPALEASCSQ